MKLGLIFAKRNFKEMIRDPLIYVFCVAFPMLMIILFAIINHYTQGNTPVFTLKSLIPGILVFAYTFVMLLMSLLVSKDRVSSLLKRLYASPMKSHDFIIGYALPGIIIGILQSVFCVLVGFFLHLITTESYFSFLSSLLLLLTEFPMLLFNVFTGILIGTLFNEKSAPGVTSILISISGLLGGCWMPLDMMGGFETFCRFLPFYPAVYLGRILTGATHTDGSFYTFDDIAKFGLIPIVVFFILAIGLSLIAFQKQKTNEKA